MYNSNKINKNLGITIIRILRFYIQKNKKLDLDIEEKIKENQSIFQDRNIENYKDSSSQIEV